MRILVLNSGSSSVKFQLIETSPEQMEVSTDRVLGRGAVDRIGAEEAVLTYEAPGRFSRREIRAVGGHAEAVEWAIGCMMEPPVGMTEAGEIDGVGHRVVHGGERFPHPARITPEVAREIEALRELAPLHNPHNLKGYYAVLAALPQTPQVAVFDTSFHQTLPRHAYLYALPHEMCVRHKLRRYGFHGTSHHYVALRYARIQHAAPEGFKLITCHLGNGCSMCAIDGGRSIDTSMGFTPLEGLIMGTRAGDVDAAAVLHLMAREGLDVAAANELLNFRSGLAGLSGLSNDIRTVIEHAERGHDRARLAIDAFCYRIKKYIGAYWAALNGADALIFTGGIGENRPPIRAQACAGLDSLGIVLDEHRNQAAAGVEMEISREGAQPQVWVIPTHEELLIARETMLCLLDEPL